MDNTINDCKDNTSKDPACVFSSEVNMGSPAAYKEHHERSKVAASATPANLHSIEIHDSKAPVTRDQGVETGGIPIKHPPKPGEHFPIVLQPQEPPVLIVVTPGQEHPGYHPHLPEKPRPPHAHR